MSERPAFGAMHSLSGRQWTLSPPPGDPTSIWPDAEIVVPFGRRVTDRTGIVAGPVVASSVQGGYTVTDELLELTITDLHLGTPMSGLTACWAASPVGGTSDLHVLAGDPFAWLTDHDTGPLARETPPALREQTFGTGPAESIAPQRRFDEITVETSGGVLTTDFEPWIATRVLRSPQALLRFHDVDERPRWVNQIALACIGENPIVVPPDLTTTPMQLQRSLGPVRTYLIEFDLTESMAPVGAIQLEVAKGDLLIGAIRYQLADPPWTSPGRRILQPGRYRIRTAGSTSAARPTDPDLRDAPAAKSVRWSVDREFTVTRPDSITPYLHSISVGDSRSFGAERGTWNPCPVGLGFPAYRQHRIALRFRSPFISAIFGDLRLSCTDVQTNAIVHDEVLTPRPNPEGSTSALPQAVAWARAHGAPIPADDELVGNVPGAGLLDPAHGRDLQASVSLPGPDGVALGTWQARLSRYGDFREHVAVGKTISTVYSPGAPSPLTECPEKPFMDFKEPPFEGEPTTPLEWMLPSALRQFLQRPGGSASTTRMLELATLIGCRFSAVPLADPLEGLSEILSETRIDVLTDADPRPLAIWLRTPESVDWRRVSAGLVVIRTTPDSGCPSVVLAHSTTAFELTAIPSPDGSSAFFVAVLAGVPSRIPRGLIEVSLTYRHVVSGLATLRRPDGMTEEQATVRLLYPYGTDWPLTSGEGRP